MSHAELGRRITAMFIADDKKPTDACSMNKSGCALDSRRWDGRSAEGCKKYFEKIKADCTKFKGCHDRVMSMKLTGNPGEDDLMRCAELLYSDGSRSASHMYDCIRNKQYHVAKPFKFKVDYLYLVERFNMLHASGVLQKRWSENNQIEQPIGSKKAKLLGKEIKKSSEKELQNANEAIVRMEATLRNAVGKKAEIAQEKLLLGRKECELDMAAKLLAPGSTIAEDKKKRIEVLLTNRLIESLSDNMINKNEMKNVDSIEDSRRNDDSKNNNDSVNAIPESASVFPNINVGNVYVEVLPMLSLTKCNAPVCKHCHSSKMCDKFSLHFYLHN